MDKRLRRAAFVLSWRASRSAGGAKAGGGGRTRTYEGVSQRIYSPPPLPLGTLPRRRTRTLADARFSWQGGVMGSALGGVNRGANRGHSRPERGGKAASMP